ncbi:MAG: hypoxanthine phosphoribosyltransferase [Bacteroidales bacterium]|jgi:hypoxanthine phosphoribosyltransferase|nr:hypoxanthine phosphoribosyltransferase [Bacteroidales bacterium]
MDIITVGDKQFEKFIDSQTIDMAIETTALQINEEYRDDVPLFLVTLNGAMFFAVDLFRHLTIDFTMSCIKLSSYEGTGSTGILQEQLGIKENVKNRRIIILEDIVDTGLTYEYIVKMLENMQPRDVRMATMTFKPDSYKKNYPIHYVALTIPSRFIVGRGLDYNGLGRNYNDIYQVINE